MAPSINFLLVYLFRSFPEELLVFEPLRGVSVYIASAAQANCVYLGGKRQCRFPFHHVPMLNVCGNAGAWCYWCCSGGVSYCEGVASASLLRPLAIEFYVITNIYILLSKSTISINITFRKTNKVVSYLITKCVA